MEVIHEAHNPSGAASAPDERRLPNPNFFASIRASVAEWSRANRIIPFGARPYAPAAVWLVAMGLAAPIAPHSEPVAACIAALGVIVAVCVVRGPLAARAAIALAMVPGATPDAPSWAWVISGGIVALLVSTRGGPVVLRSHDLQRHLDWCRRRQENAHVLVMRFSLREVPKPIRILDSFRTTDSIALHYSHGLCELQAVLDDAGFSREGVERRIVEATDAGFRFGWAAFPADGVTLDALIETAGEQLVEEELDVQLPELAESYA
jgi:hypothetical protein